MQNLLGAKYIVSLSPNTDLAEEKEFITSEGQHFYLQENPDAIPIGGLIYRSYLTQNEVPDLEPEEYALLMSRVMVISEEQTDESSLLLTHAQWDAALLDAPISYVEINDFSIGNNSFSCTAISESAGYELFSVPYDKYWKCYVNEQQVKILDTNGLLAIPIHEGESQINFVYQYDPLNCAVLCSVLGAVICVSILCFNRHYARKKKSSFSLS